MPTFYNYMEDIQEDIDSIKFATDKLYKELQTIKSKVKALQKLTGKYTESSYIVDNYDIEDPDSYGWSNEVDAAEYDASIDAWNEFMQSGIYFDEMSEGALEINSKLSEILDIIENYD